MATQKAWQCYTWGRLAEGVALVDKIMLGGAHRCISIRAALRPLSRCITSCLTAAVGLALCTRRCCFYRALVYPRLRCHRHCQACGMIPALLPDPGVRKRATWASLLTLRISWLCCLMSMLRWRGAPPPLPQRGALAEAYIYTADPMHTLTLQFNVYVEFFISSTIDLMISTSIYK